jgi:hypothetical protein
VNKFLGIDLNKSLAKKGTIIALALAVVIGMSYFSSQDYLNISIMDMLMGETGGLTIYNSLQEAMDAEGITDFEKDTSKQPNPYYDNIGNTELKNKLEAQDPGTWKKVYQYGTSDAGGCGFDLHYFQNTNNSHVFSLKSVNN